MKTRKTGRGAVLSCCQQLTPRFSMCQDFFAISDKKTSCLIVHPTRGSGSHQTKERKCTMKQLLSIDTNAKTVKGQKYGFLTGILYLAPADSASTPELPINVCPMAELAQ